MQWLMFVKENSQKKIIIQTGSFFFLLSSARGLQYVLFFRSTCPDIWPYDLPIPIQV